MGALGSSPRRAMEGLQAQPEPPPHPIPHLSREADCSLTAQLSGPRVSCTFLPGVGLPPRRVWIAGKAAPGKGGRPLLTESKMRRNMAACTKGSLTEIMSLPWPVGEENPENEVPYFRPLFSQFPAQVWLKSYYWAFGRASLFVSVNYRLS